MTAANHFIARRSPRYPSQRCPLSAVIAHALPAWSRHRAREVHQDARTRWQEQVTYFDASGETAMVKVRAAPDPARPAATSDRWVGSGDGRAPLRRLRTT